MGPNPSSQPGCSSAPNRVDAATVTPTAAARPCRRPSQATSSLCRSALVAAVFVPSAPWRASLELVAAAVLVAPGLVAPGLVVSRPLVSSVAATVVAATAVQAGLQQARWARARPVQPGPGQVSK